MATDRESKLASEFSSYKGKIVGSGSAKLAASKSSSPSSNSKQTPEQYRAATAAKSAKEIKAGRLITSTQGRRVGINRTQQALAALQKQSTSTQSTPQPAFTSTSGLLDVVPSGRTLTPAQQAAAEQYLMSQTSSKTANASNAELANIRNILGTGYQSPQTLSVFKEPAKKQAMIKALESDIYYRGQRIDNRDKKLSQQKNNLDNAEMALRSYNHYIKDGQFTGTKEQYNRYKSAYDKYNRAYNTYNSTLQLQNEDIKTYNKNAQNIDSKKSFKQVSKAASATLTRYRNIERAVSGKLPSVKQAEPYIRAAIKASSTITPIPTAAGITRITDKVLKRNDTKKIIQFNLGAYESVQKQPLKAAATFATFFVGGIAAKGMGTAAKTLGAGAKTAKVAKLIESGLVAVYVTQSGKRLMTVEDARQAGYVTGDIIFNELLPAGLGLKYGIKVVDRVPAGVRKIRGTGTKVKSGVKELAVSERAALGRDTAVKTRAVNKEADKIVNDIERIIKKSETVDEYAILKNGGKTAYELRMESKARRSTKAKESSAYAKEQSAKAKTRVKESVARSKAKTKAAEANTAKKAAARKETLATATSKQLRASEAKKEFMSSTSVLRGKDAAPTVTNITRQSKNLIDKAIRTRMKYNDGRISKATYDRQMASIRKMAKEIESLKKYATDTGVDVKTPNVDKSVSIAIRNTNLLKASLTNAGINSIIKYSLLGKNLPQYKILEFTKPKTKQAIPTQTVNVLQQVTKSPVKSKLPATTKTAKKTPTPSTSKRRTPRTTKITEEQPLKIVPKLASITKTTKKRKPSKKKTIGTAKQRNVNAVATFKDLFG